MKSYIELLIWTMLFVSVVEMIFPNSELKKYLKLVLSLTVIYALISPLLQYSLLDTSLYENYVKSYSLAIDMDEAYNNKLKEQQQNTQEIYKSELEQTLQLQLEKQLPIEVTAVEVILGAKDLEIKAVHLNVVRKHEKEEVFIPAIQIGDKSQSLMGSDEKLEKEIKSCLKNFYNLKEANIYITVQRT